MAKYLFFILMFYNFSIAQTNWKSKKYDYQVEIPNGFQTKSATGANVDFKVVDKYGNSIVIVVKKIPAEYKNKSIVDILGSPEESVNYWKQVANEIFNTPKLIKYGKTIISNKQAYWMDYTTDNDTYYYKNYSIKKGELFFAITFFASKKEWNYYSAIWFRFKEQMKL